MLFHSICISQCVEGMLAIRAARRHTGYHTRPGLLPYKGILENLCKLAAAERSVAMFFLQGSYDFFEGEERGVDLSALHASLLVLVGGVCTSFTTCKVDET